MNIKYLIPILLIALLTLECCSQRGGGRSRSRSSRRSGGSLFFGSRSRSYRSGNGTSLWNWLFGSDQNATHTNSKDSSSYDSSTLHNDDRSTSTSNNQNSTSWVGWIFGGIVAIFAFLGFKDKGLSGQSRNKQIRKVTDKFEQDNEYRSSLSDNQRTNFIDKFMQSRWRVQIKVGLSHVIYTWNMKMKDLTKRTDFVYEIEAQGYNDENGNSSIKGIILFRDNSMSICFDKLHNDRERAGQTGKWDLLIYEGHLNGLNFQGEWYYKGFRNDKQYSGKMKMCPM